MSKKLFTEIAGWYGAAAVLLAYALVSFHLIDAQGFIYQILNFTGAAGVACVSVAKKARQPAVLNITWAVVALVAIIGLLLPRIN